MTFRFTQPPIRSPFDKNDIPTQEWIDWTNQIYRIVNTVVKSGTTAQRPSKLFVGQMYFDTTLGRPIWVNAAGTGWVKSDGTAA